jgi:hypothetical protein
MSVSRHFAKRVVFSVLFAFIGVRLADAHLHLCLDGEEAPISLHTADLSIHDDPHHQSEDHEDRDVESIDAPPVKVQLGSDPFLVPDTIQGVALIAQLMRTRVDSPSESPARPPPHLRPPLRGPPH